MVGPLGLALLLASFREIMVSLRLAHPLGLQPNRLFFCSPLSAAVSCIATEGGGGEKEKEEE